MLKVERTQFCDLPPTLQADLISRQNDVDNGNEADTAWKDFNGSHRLELISALENDFHHKCAYCETSLDKDSGDVEHFWPKSPHPQNSNRGTPLSNRQQPPSTSQQNGLHGMFIWNNLFWSCKTCNGFSCKASRLQWNRQQKIMLLNPCNPQDDPYFYLQFGVEGFERGRVYPKPDLVPDEADRAEYTIRRLKLLDRDALVSARARKISQFLGLVQCFLKLGPDQTDLVGKTIAQLLADLLSKNSPYLAPIRQLLLTPLPEQTGTLYQVLRGYISNLDDLLVEWQAFPTSGIDNGIDSHG